MNLIGKVMVSLPVDSNRMNIITNPKQLNAFLMRQFKGKQAIFVDFFDTIMFRKIHPFQVYERWSLLLSNWLSNEVTASEILNYRFKALANLSKRGIELNWKQLYTELYGFLNSSIKEKNNIDTFLAICHRLEVDVEIGVQYPNNNLLRRLKSYKNINGGTKFYIVSDFHLDKNDIRDFLKSKNIDTTIFDDIFVSSDYCCSKFNGELYKIVLDKVNIEPEHILMIGDNPYSDGKMARQNQIRSKIEYNLIRKLIYQLRRLIRYDYSKHSFESIEKTCRRYNSPYCEYGLIFQYFSKILRNTLLSKGARHVTFLSREGHYLKRSFDGIMAVSPPCCISSNYFMCSRRSCQSIDEKVLSNLPNSQISLYDYLMACGYDEAEILEIANKYNLSVMSLNKSDSELRYNADYVRLASDEAFAEMINNKIITNKKCFKKYIDSFPKDNVMNIVDIGWRGSMQKAIEDVLGGITMGYYLGINNSIYSLHNKNGLLFTFADSGTASAYSNILRTNTQLYEQLAAAPHGSAIGYTTNNDGGIKVLTDWAKNEKELYCSTIKDLQDEMLLVERGAAVWTGGVNCNKELRACAKLVLRSALFADKERLCFLKKLDYGFIWNFNSQHKGLSYNIRDAKISLDIIYSPEKYTRYFSKIQRMIPYSFQSCYRLIATLLYGYIWIITLVKEFIIEATNNTK